MLSQHTVNKDRPLDDIALHVFEEHQTSASARVLHPQRAESNVSLSHPPCGLYLNPQSPYSNGLHTLVRFTPRRPNSDLVIIASRDRGIFQRDFTLQAFAPSAINVKLERIKASLPFSYTMNGHLNSRNAGGHPGNPSHMINPQYKVVIRPDARKIKGVVRMVVQGDREMSWNVKLVWGNGTRVTESVTLLHQSDVGADNLACRRMR
jgi:calpain-7